MQKLTAIEQFFYDNAGASWNPGAGETREQGTARAAKALAKAEAEAGKRGFGYRWSIDREVDSSEFNNEKPFWKLWQCAMMHPKGGCTASLHGIDFGRDGSPYSDSYARVVQAELALEGLHNEPQGSGY
jgi:hypothetical protein